MSCEHEKSLNYLPLRLEPRPLPVIDETAARPGSYARVKVVLDITLAFLGLVLTSPVVLLSILLIKCTSRGPVLYTQVRLGKEGRPFRILKLRTMVHECEQRSGVCWSSGNDPRVTRIGRWLRKTHVDELPQLWNVLRGEMSLVGPRPERPEFIPELKRVIAGYEGRQRVLPGLTGLAQVQLPPDTNLASVRRKLRYDLYYVDHLSLSLDLRLLACTACRVLGLPFRFARVLFRIPAETAVEVAHDFSAHPQAG